MAPVSVVPCTKPQVCDVEPPKREFRIEAFQVRDWDDPCSEFHGRKVDDVDV